MPWFNYQVQGIKRISEAWVRDPVNFTEKVWLYSVLPATIAYIWNRSQGPAAVDYVQNRRTGYQKSMELAFVTNPEHPEEGLISLPWVHELALPMRATQVLLDHSFGNPMFDQNKDLDLALRGWLEVMLGLPLPAGVPQYEATQGHVAPMGIFSGESSYELNRDPFDQLNPFPLNAELLIRSYAGGLAQATGAAYTTFMTSDEQGLNALAEAGSIFRDRQLERLPVAGPALGFDRPVPYHTDARAELDAKTDALRLLEDYYKEWTRNQGRINTDPQSKAGGEKAQEILGDVGIMPSQRMGPSQPPPTNDLYKQFMGIVYSFSQHDSESGVRSIWARHGDVTKQIRAIKNIHTDKSWNKFLSDKPELVEFYKKRGVDYTSHRRVRNFLEKERQTIGFKLLEYINKAEQQIGIAAGIENFKIEDLNPYSGGNGQSASPSPY